MRTDGEALLAVGCYSGSGVAVRRAASERNPHIMTHEEPQHGNVGLQYFMLTGISVSLEF